MRRSMSRHGQLDALSNACMQFAQAGQARLPSNLSRRSKVDDEQIV
jgi:hypothetical protein